MFAAASHPAKKTTCPENHPLFEVDDLCEFYDGESYTDNIYFCDACRENFHSILDPSHHCMVCKFDLCTKCYEAQKVIKIDCPKNHPLLKVQALKKFSKYSSDRYRCNSCMKSFDSTVESSAHCRTCRYDLCPSCLEKTQSKPRKEEVCLKKAETTGTTTKTRRSKCPKNHTLSRVNNLKEVHPFAGELYEENLYVCDTCRTKYSCVTHITHHCKTCEFDLCSKCYKAQKKISVSCPLSHNLLVVSALEKFSGPSYKNDFYSCRTCKITFDSSRSPSAHCQTCKFDLCPNCVTTESHKKEEHILKAPDFSTNQVTCLKRHPLICVNNLSLLHPMKGSYGKDIYRCNACRGKYSCKDKNTYHCMSCNFDLCPCCHQKAQDVQKITCSKSHPLFIVSALEKFSGPVYTNGFYSCNS